MNLPPGAFRYLVIGQAIIPFFINIVVNVILGALTFGGQESVSTWAIDKGAAADSIGTCFFLVKYRNRNIQSFGRYETLW